MGYKKSVYPLKNCKKFRYLTYKEYDKLFGYLWWYGMSSGSATRGYYVVTDRDYPLQLNTLCMA